MMVDDPSPNGGSDDAEQLQYRGKPIETRTRKRIPYLTQFPAPSGKYKHFVDYIGRALELSGSGQGLGVKLGFTSGSRISDWRRGRGGRPSISSCIRLARLTGDEPQDVLAMAGYTEEAEAIQEWIEQRVDKAQDAASFGATRPKSTLIEAKAFIQEAIERLEKLER